MTAEVELEQQPTAQAGLLAIDNATGEIKALVGGYDFEQSKFDRATQAMRQTGSSFKVYVYSEALSQGMSPFDTVVDEPVTYHSGGQDYSPHNYDEKFEGRITLRRALADSRNVPAVRLLDRVGIENTIDLARKFGLVSPLPPYLPLALGAADLTLHGAHVGVHRVSRRRHPHRAALHPARDVVRRQRARRGPAERDRRAFAGRGADDDGDA